MNPRRSILSVALACLLLLVSGAISCTSSGSKSEEVSSEEYRVMSAAMRILDGEMMSIVKSLPLLPDSTPSKVGIRDFLPDSTADLAEMATFKRQKDSLFQVYSRRACCFIINRRTVKSPCFVDSGIFDKEAAIHWSPQIERDFYKNNESTYELDSSRFEDSLVLGTYSLSEIDSAISQDSWIEAFRQKYPKSGGVFEFSRVGFSADSTVALVYVGSGEPNTGGSECLLIEKDSVWQMLSHVDCFR